jgi:autotransporter-associated beta strand protein
VFKKFAWKLWVTTSYSGQTIIFVGTLEGGATNSFSPNSIHQVEDVLSLNGFDNKIANLSGTSGTVSLGSNTLTLGNGNNNNVFGGAITGTGGGITKVGNGDLTLTGAGLNTYTGTTTISEGTLQAGGGTNALSPNSAIVLADTAGATLTLIPPSDHTIASLAGGGTTGGNVVIGNNSTLTVGNSNNTTFAGSISGPGGAITKVGSGALTLSGTNTYSGAINVVSGRLVVNGSISSSTTTVGSGGTLKELEQQVLSL